MDQLQLEELLEDFIDPFDKWVKISQMKRVLRDIEQDMKQIKNRHAIWYSLFYDMVNIITEPFDPQSGQIGKLTQNIGQQYDRYVQNDDLQLRACSSVIKRLITLKPDEKFFELCDKIVIQRIKKEMEELLEEYRNLRIIICDRSSKKMASLFCREQR